MKKLAVGSRNNTAIMLNPDLIRQIQIHAELEYPRECCGFVLNNSVVFGARNVSDRASPYSIGENKLAAEFDLPAEDWAKAEQQGEITCVYHSHCGDIEDDFSPDDIKAAKQLSLPFFLIHVPKLTERYYDPRAIAPFEEREWHWAYQNCYTLLQDWYKAQLGIHLPDYYMSEPEEWHRAEWSPFLSDLPKIGFVKVEDGSLKRHDVILMRSEDSANPCHVGIMIDLERNWMLHHVGGARSRKSIYGSRWGHGTHSVWRWKDFI